MLHEMLIEDEIMFVFGLTIFFFTLHIPSFPKLFTVRVLGVTIPLSSAD